MLSFMLEKKLKQGQLAMTNCSNLLKLEIEIRNFLLRNFLFIQTKMFVLVFWPSVNHYIEYKWIRFEEQGRINLCWHLYILFYS